MLARNPRVLTRLLGVAAVLAVLAALRAGAGARADEWREVGNWATVANADDVRALARDGNGLWVATEGGGAARWTVDGRALRQYVSPQDGLPCNDVRDVAAWRGRWWFATCDGLAVYDAARDRMSAVTAPLPSLSVTGLAVDASDRLWAATEPTWDPDLALEGAARPGGWVGGGVASSVDGATWLAYRVGDGLPSANVRDVVGWGGAVWVATEPYSRWQAPGDDPGGEPTDGHWEVTGGGVARFDGSAWQVFDSEAVAGLSDSTRVLAGASDTLWVGTGGRGLAAYRGGKWATLGDCGDPLRCIQDDYVTALAVAGDGSVWVGTARFNGRGTGLAVLDDRGTPAETADDAWHVYGALDGLPAEGVRAILPDAVDASVWLGVSQLTPDGRTLGRGLVHLLSDRRTIVPLRSVDVGAGLVAGNDVSALARNTATGELWVGTDGSGVSVRRTDGTWRTYTYASTGGLLASDSIADVVVEPDGTVWAAGRQTLYDSKAGRWVDGGLSRFDGTAWTVMRGTASGLPSDHLSALALDGRGKLWIGTGATDRGPKEHAYRGWGLAVVDTRTRRWERTFTYPTLTSNNISDLAVSGKFLWVSTAYFYYVDTRPGGAQLSTGGGVSVYDLDTAQWRKITAQQGLTPGLVARGQTQPLLDLRSIEIDRAGVPWVGGMAYPNGTYVPDVVPDGVVDVIGSDRITSHRFAGSGAVVAVRRDPTGYIWAGTSAGGVHIWVGGTWIHRARTRGGLPSNDLSALSFAGGEVWIGTAGHGLAHLEPGGVGPAPATATATGIPGTPPTGTPVPGPGTVTPPEATPTESAVIKNLTERVFLPAVRRGLGAGEGG